MTRSGVARVIRSLTLPVTLAATIGAAAWGPPAVRRDAGAQDAEAKPADSKSQGPKDWKQVEADPRMEAFKAKLREGVPDTAFVTNVALPQLALPANRPRIDWVRRRIREQLSADATLPLIADFSQRLARDPQADLAVRVNAMLLLGELTKTPDKRPWPDALEPLLGAVVDPALPMAVRAAAVVGLGEHVAARGGAEVGPAAGPVLLDLVRADPTAADAVGVNWMAGRALKSLAQLGPEAPPETTGVALATLVDEARPLDLRVRAAVAIGACAGEGRPLDVPAALQGIRSLAAGIIGAEKDRANQRSLEANLGMAGGMPVDPSMMGMGFPGGPAGAGFPAAPGFPGGPGVMPGGPGFPGGPGGMPTSPGTVPYGLPGYDPANPAAGTPSPIDESLVLPFRRAAWRLSMLAEALQSESRGIAVVAGPLQGVALAMAKVLREVALEIDAAPKTSSIDKAFKAITGVDPAAAGPAPQAAEEPAAGKPAGGAAAAPPTGQPATSATPTPPAGAAGPADGNPFAQ